MLVKFTSQSTLKGHRRSNDQATSLKHTGHQHELLSTSALRVLAQAVDTAAQASHAVGLRLANNVKMGSRVRSHAVKQAADVLGSLLRTGLQGNDGAVANLLVVADCLQQVATLHSDLTLGLLELERSCRCIVGTFSKGALPTCST